MDGPGSLPSAEPLLATLAKALQEELDQLKAARRDVVLFSGRRVGAFAGYTYYRFELPEEVLLRTTERATVTIGRQDTISVEGNVITIENQFLTIALPRDFGPLLPEITCQWDYEQQLGPVVEELQQLEEHAGLIAALFNPASAENKHVVNFSVPQLPSTPPDQVGAVSKVLQNKVTLLWGPRRSGKTHTLAMAAAAYLKAGKRVLFVAPTNDNVDEMLLKTVEIGRQLNLDMEALAARVDLPSLSLADAVRQFSFDHQIDAAREEKRKVFQERVSLLRTYWNVKLRQILHEDFYLRIQEMRARVAELKRQADTIYKDINQLTEAINRYGSASVLERIKKGFSREDVEAAQKQLSDRQQKYKRLMAIQQGLSDEITRIELNAPISADDMKSFRAAVKRMDELGGLEKVTHAVDAFIAVDEAGLLRSKQFVATSVVTAFLDPVIRSQHFDMVLVDDAQLVNMPTLAALAGLTKEKLVLAGDPFLMQPESVSNTVLAQQWLQRDIFLNVAGTDELHRLFDWTSRHAQYCVLLASHYATTPKLSLFCGSILYDDKINVFVPPTAKGRIYFIDTSDLNSRCKQYLGRKRMLPYNDLQARRAVECVKHALMEPGRRASDVGIIVPFTGPTLYTKLWLRLQAIGNVEVGTPSSFAAGRKKAIIFDTTMAGVDYTMRAIDDKKVGEHRIARLFNTVFSCVGEDLYILADMKHFKALYKDRLFVRLLMLLEAEADEKNLSLSGAVKKFDELDLQKRTALMAFSAEEPPAATARPAAESAKPEKLDAELELKLKMLSRQREGKPMATGRDFERETYFGAMRVLGYRADINLLSQFVGGDLLFRSSFATEDAMGRLPWMLCENEKHFRQVMELWNLLIYESSGGSKTEVTYFAHTGPEARVRQDIRNLKAFYSLDVRAVIEEGKQKIAVEVSKVFQDLLGKSQPANPVEWSTAYLSFLARLESYLSWISEQVRR